eukprot:6532564-Pyramimonas_sp.AAC.1
MLQRSLQTLLKRLPSKPFAAALPRGVEIVIQSRQQTLSLLDNSFILIIWATPLEPFNQGSDGRACPGHERGKQSHASNAYQHPTWRLRPSGWSKLGGAPRG